MVSLIIWDTVGRDYLCLGSITMYLPLLNTSFNLCYNRYLHDDNSNIEVLCFLSQQQVSLERVNAKKLFHPRNLTAFWQNEQLQPTPCPPSLLPLAPVVSSNEQCLVMKKITKCLHFESVTHNVPDSHRPYPPSELSYPTVERPQHFLIEPLT